MSETDIDDEVEVDVQIHIELDEHLDGAFVYVSAFVVFNLTAVPFFSVADLDECVNVFLTTVTYVQ